MALDAQHRSSIYQKLLPILGDDDTNALMTQYPSIEADELVTKEFLRAELALTRGELRGEMTALRTELRGEMAELRTELRGEMAALRTELRGEMAELGGEMAELGGEMAELRTETRTGLAALESRLLVRMGAAMAAQITLLLAAFSLLR